MNPIADFDLLSHAFEIRLLLAVIIVPVSYAAIQAVSFLASAATALLAKFNNFGASNVATGAFSTAGAR